MPGMSPVMSLKGDPDMHMKKALAKYSLQKWEGRILRSLESEPGSLGSMKKHFISIVTGADYYDIDLKDPVTWGDMPEGVAMPPDEAFIEMYGAMIKDIKRREKRSSYEF